MDVPTVGAAQEVDVVEEREEFEEGGSSGRLPR